MVRSVCVASAWALYPTNGEGSTDFCSAAMDSATEKAEELTVIGRVSTDPSIPGNSGGAKKVRGLEPDAIVGDAFRRVECVRVASLSMDLAGDEALATLSILLSM